MILVHCGNLHARIMETQFIAEIIRNLRKMSEEKSVSIKQFRAILETLRQDECSEYTPPTTRTQKEHWNGWINGYFGPGYYGRKNWNRDAKFVYNHVVCPELLVYLIRALEIEPGLAEKVEEAYLLDGTMMERAGRIRKIVPWSVIYPVISERVKPSLVKRLQIWCRKKEG